MMIDDRGNAIDFFEDFTIAAESLKELCEEDPTAIDEVVLMEMDMSGMPVAAFTYEDLNA